MSREIEGIKYLTKNEVIERLDISKRTIRNWIEKGRKGKLKNFFLRTAKDPINGIIYFLEEDITKYEKRFEKSLK